MECKHCAAPVPEGHTSCPACSTLPAPPSAPLLAEANLLRTQGRLDEAISLCTRVLRQDPASAPAHALLGDIYREQGNPREALGWYKLAVQLNPTNPALRKKLDEMIDQVFQGAARGEQKPLPPPGQDLPDSAAGSARVRRFLLALHPVHVVLACTVLALGIGALLIVGGSRPPTPRSAGRVITPATPAPSPARESATNTHPVVAPPPPDAVELPPQATGSATVTPPTAPLHSGPATRTGTHLAPPDAPLSPAEVDRQLELVKSAMHAEIKAAKLPAALREVTIDPRTRMVLIDYAVARGATPTQTKQVLLYAGFHLVWATPQAGLAPKGFTLRGYAYPQNGPSETLALIADLAPLRAEAARTITDYGAIAQFLTSPWWRKDLDAAPL
jgi:tetratricopeptide (TPR) repeat protein